MEQKGKARKEILVSSRNDDRIKISLRPTEGDKKRKNNRLTLVDRGAKIKQT